MSTDKELLGLAAKAAGMHTNLWAEPGEVLAGKGGWVQHIGHGLASVWNPLTDDGDAMRLMVKLRLCVEVVNGCTTIGNVVWIEDPDEGEVDGVIHGEDPYAATRRAITRAAAEIGRQMP